MALTHVVEFIVLVAVMATYCSAQAPGDGDTRCTEDEDAPTYSDNEKTLMDSYHYLQLLPGNGSGNIIPGAVWNDRSLDGNDDEMNTINPTYWQQGAGGVCRFQVRVCGWEKPGADQNNWLFTQHISKNFNHTRYNYPVEIKVHVIYALQSCRERLGCVMGFRLHNYTTNTQQVADTTGSGYMNTENYNQFGRARSPTQTARFETHTFTLDSSDTGFYVALQDTGTCVGISRLRVYRYNCPSRQVGIVLYPETPASLSDREDVNISCVPNADISGSPQVTCRSNGTWGPENPVCKCDCGYEERPGECFACPAGQYRSKNDTTCQNCPDNTVTDQYHVGVCECLDGYFRNNENRVTDSAAQSFLSTPNEGPNAACTKPPSAPSGLNLTDVSSTSISVNWSPSAETGGRSDLYYKVEYSDPDNLGSFTGAVYLNGTSHTFTGLRPYTSYCIRVSAHNGVSDQDPDRSQGRMVEECTTTPEDIPSPVTGVEGHCSVIVWKEPNEPNGEISNYTLFFIPNNDGNEGMATDSDGIGMSITTPNNQLFFVINNTFNLPESESIFVKVLARNGAGEGDYSNLTYIGCKDPPGPNVTIPRPPITDPEPVENISAKGDLLYWERPPGRISFFKVKCYDENDNILFEKTTTETQYLLTSHELQCLSIKVCSVLYGVEGKCSDSYQLPQEEPVQNISIEGDLLYWEMPPGSISFFKVKCNDKNNSVLFEEETTETQYLLTRRELQCSSIKVCSVLYGVESNCSDSYQLTQEEPVQSISMEGDLIYWEIPPGRASFFKVKCYDEDNNALFEKETTETQYLLTGDELECLSVEVCSVLYGVEGKCSDSYQLTREEPVQSISTEGDLIYWERPPGRVSFFQVKCYDEENNVLFEKETNETRYLLTGDELQCSSVEVCSVLNKVQSKCSDLQQVTRKDTGEDSEETCTGTELMILASVTCGATALIVGTGCLLVAAIHHCRYRRRFGKNKEALTWEDYKLKDIH